MSAINKTRNYKITYMKKFIITLLSTVCAATVSAQNFRENIVISHRGAWKNTGHPQNSLAYDELNNGQQKKLLKDEKIKLLFERYGVNL